MLTSTEDIKPEVLAQYVTRLQAGETIPMSALVYLRLTEYIQALPDESKFQEFGRLASNPNHQLSLGLIVIYDIFLKPRSSESFIEVASDELAI